MREAGLEIDPAATTEILTGFIRNELERTGFSRLVVGLSGGLDSAASAFLAARALGPDRVHAVLMPYRSSSRESLTDAALVSDALGIGTETVEITPMVEGYRESAADMDRLRLGNVMARCRMIVLYDLSAREKALVLGTSNKTEILLGYGTLHGDMASALNPIGDLYKTQVRQLARYLGVPDAVISKLPSADLWPDQSDEDELGFTYEEVDRLLALLVDARVSPATAVGKGFSREMVDRVLKLIVGSQFKRRLPVIAKVSTRSVGWDFRYPRDWNS
jgi:NAD+ synthase